jgi:hypothetical protein
VSEGAAILALRVCAANPICLLLSMHSGVIAAHVHCSRAGKLLQENYAKHISYYTGRVPTACVASIGRKQHGSVRALCMCSCCGGLRISAGNRLRSNRVLCVQLCTGAKCDGPSAA